MKTYSRGRQFIVRFRPPCLGGSRLEREERGGGGVDIVSWGGGGGGYLKLGTHYQTNCPALWS